MSFDNMNFQNDYRVRYVTFGDGIIHQVPNGYVTNSFGSGGVCLCCGQFSGWPEFSDEEKGVCRTCFSASESIVRYKQYKDQAFERAKTEIILDRDWFSEIVSRTPSGEK